MNAPLAHFADQLAALAARSRLRTLEANSTAQGTEISIDGRRLINFSSNDYLGLASHPALREALKAGIDRYGVGAGAAALLSGYSTAHADLAARLATLLKRDRVLLFSSGYLANLGVISGLVARHDTVYHDRLNHASLIDGVRLSGARHVRYPHRDTAALAQRIEANNSGQRWVVTDGVFSMDGDLAPLPALSALAHACDAILVCDDAHGFGVIGEGLGVLHHYQLDQEAVPLLVLTFGKALGTVGAAVAGPAALIDTLVQSARTFIYDTALPPALAHATGVALDLAVADHALRHELAVNIRCFHDALRAADLPVPMSTTPIQPMVLGADTAALRVAEELRAQGFYLRAVRPPTVPAGTARLRICLSAAHTTSQITRLVETLARFKTEFRRPDGR